MRNPKWHRKELILALNLYFRLEPGQIHARNPEIIALSENQNKLNIYKDKSDAIKYRNPNGMGLKLSNFLAIDLNYPGKGMSRFSKLDKEIFEEFKDDKNRLKLLAFEIESSIQ